VPFQNNTKGYFQFLGGHLVRAFDHISTSKESIHTQEIIRSGTKFYDYTRVFEGLKDGLWSKIGNVAIENNFKPPLFRQTSAPYSITKKSFKWNIFEAGSPTPGRRSIM
jgi:hypothetical protein